MKHHFQIIPINTTEIQHLWQLDEAGLQARHARRIRVDQKPGYPCRLSLQDAEVGEEVILWHYEHHPANSPYRASGPIFTRVNATPAKLAVDEIPLMLNHRLLSLRAYRADGILLGAKVCPGKELPAAIDQFFDQTTVAYLQVHNAGPGCYNCQINRA